MKAPFKTNGTMSKTKGCSYYDIKGIYSDYDDCGYYIGDTGKFAVSQAKRVKNIYPFIYENENLLKASHNAQKGKQDLAEVKDFNAHYLDRMQDLYTMIVEETYNPTAKDYRERIIYDPKERVIMIAPFFPDRIVHHLIINVLGRYWTNQFIGNTYACIKGRGIHKCMEDVHRALVTDRNGTRYCLKIDIRKFYDNVDHSALKRIIRYSIADEQMLRLLDKIIDSNGKEKGLPIGNYTSQYLANLYLAYFDHWMKEKLGVKYYFRYMDDIVILAESKERLHYIFDMMGLYLAADLKVEIKPNWQIFPVDSRNIDFVGFAQNHYGILLRKGILKRFYIKLKKTQKKYEIKNKTDIKHLFPSEYGWIIRCSEEHSNFIFNQCINNGHKCFDTRTAL